LSARLFTVGRRGRENGGECELDPSGLIGTTVPVVPSGAGHRECGAVHGTPRWPAGLPWSYSHSRPHAGRSSGRTSVDGRSVDSTRGRSRSRPVPTTLHPRDRTRVGLRTAERKDRRDARVACASDTDAARAEGRRQDAGQEENGRDTSEAHRRHRVLSPISRRGAPGGAEGGELCRIRRQALGIRRRAGKPLESPPPPASIRGLDPLQTTHARRGGPPPHRGRPACRSIRAGASDGRRRQKKTEAASRACSPCCAASCTESGDAKSAAMGIASVAQETPALPQASIDYVLDGDEELRTVERAVRRRTRSRRSMRWPRPTSAWRPSTDTRRASRAANLLAGLGFACRTSSVPSRLFRRLAHASQSRARRS